MGPRNISSASSALGSRISAAEKTGPPLKTGGGPGSAAPSGSASSDALSCLAINAIRAKDIFARNSWINRLFGQPGRSPVISFSSFSLMAAPWGPTPAQGCHPIGLNSHPLALQRASEFIILCCSAPLSDVFASSDVLFSDRDSG